MKGFKLFASAFSAALFVLSVSLAFPVMPGHLFDYTTRRALAWLNPRRLRTVPITN